jgi:hypothetical protein
MLSQKRGFLKNCVIEKSVYSDSRGLDRWQLNLKFMGEIIKGYKIPFLVET